MREAGGDVRFAAAERRAKHRRLQQPLEPGRAEAQHDFAERDDLHRAAPAVPLRAAATLDTTRRALAVSTAKSPRAMAAASTSAEPRPTATAPARIHSPALSRLTPPVGISFTCGSGARTSL